MKMRTTRPSGRGISAYSMDRLEDRVMLAVDSELRWMIERAGGTTTPSPALTVASNLATSGGYAKTTTPATATFNGTADAAATSSVKVNGVAAAYSAGTWSLANAGNAIGLSPGVNRVQVRSYDASNLELTRKTLDVWYDDGSVASVSGTLAGNTNWTSAGGPYLVTASVTVPTGVTLTIGAGTSVYFAAGTTLNVANGGRLNVQGNDFGHVRMTRDPVAAANWGGLSILSPQDNQINYVDLEYASTGSRAVQATNAKIALDHVTFANIGKQYVDMVATSMSISNSVFPTTTNVEPIHATNMLGTAGSFAVFRRNVHGTTTGYNDVIDFTGGQRPGAILQVYDSWFIGGQDDGLDLDSTDAWIENNVFEHFHQPNGRSTPESLSHAVSTGNENSGTTELTLVRNYFSDNDHALVVKDGASASLINNTIVNVHKPAAATQATTAAINLYEVRSGQYQAVNVVLDGNIFQDISALFELPQPFAAGHPDSVKISMSRNILPVGVTYPAAGATITMGPGNSSVDPKLVNVVNVLDPTVDFQLQAGSPAKGAGPNGVDIGAAIPTGASISGELAAFTNSKNASLIVGTTNGLTGTNVAGYTAYKYRLNNGAYSAETPIGTPISLTNLADGTYTVFVVGKNDAGVYQAEADMTASKTWTVDTVAPKVLVPTFNYQLAAQSLVVPFGEDVGASLAKGDLKLKNLTTNLDVDMVSVTLAYNAGSKTATLTFPGLAGAKLTDGNYRLTVTAAGVTDLAGNALDGNGNGTGGDDFTFDFFQLNGDANRDRHVDFADLVVVAQHYDGTGGWAEGDFNGDGLVGFPDLVVVAQQYDSFLQPLPAPPVASLGIASASAEVTAAVRTQPPVTKAAPAPVKKPAAVVKPSTFSTSRVR